MLGIVELCGVVGLARVVGALLRGMDVAVPTQVAVVRKPAEHRPAQDAREGERAQPPLALSPGTVGRLQVEAGLGQQEQEGGRQQRAGREAERGRGDAAIELGCAAAAALPCAQRQDERGER